jgi:Zn2+/Cd2+-exporting ATPase
MERVTISVSGMDCPNESRVIAAALGALPGVRGVDFELMRQRVHVSWDASEVSLPGVLRCIRATGFSAEVVSARDSAAAASSSFTDASESGVPFPWRVGTATVLLLAAVFLQSVDRLPWFPELIPAAAAKALFSLSILASASTFAGRALGSLKQRRADMNLLVLVATVGAVLLGEWVEAALVSLLFATAHLLEGWSAARVRKSIEGFCSLMPQEALRIDESAGAAQSVGVDALRPGDLLLVKPGAHVPADGVVESGWSWVDQAALTGESLPLEARPGVSVLAGSTNGEGSLHIRATSDAAHSRARRVEEAIQEAQLRRSPTERWVERFARIYTPVVLLTGVAVACLPLLAGVPFSQSFYAALVLILIACPCALVIATPVTMVSAISGLARRGVLLRGAESLERAAKVRAIAFDKTGVLTTGELKLAQIRFMPGVDPQCSLLAAAAVERLSEHPAARAVVTYATSACSGNTRVMPEAIAFQALPGLGGHGLVDGKQVWVGSPALAESHGAWSRDARHLADALLDSEGSLVCAGTGADLWFLATLSDRPRPEAKVAVSRLQAMGLARVSMLSGDHRSNCERVAGSAGIADVYASLLPEQKLEMLSRLQQEHGQVAMVGDGINDAPAMAAAWMSIAAGDRAADVTLQAADAVVWGGDLRRMPLLLSHARRTMRTVHWNAAFAIGSKAVVAVLAAAGLATLWMAVLADVGATLLVTANGLRLLRIPQPAEIETSEGVAAPITSS